MRARGSHADRPVAIVGGAIVKRYRDARRAHDVHATMLSLWNSRFGRSRRPPGLPEPIALEGTAVVMERIDGPPAALRGELGATTPSTESVAALLADLHASGATVGRERSGAGILRSLQRKLHDLDHPALRRHFAAVVQSLDADDLGGTPVVSHGDFSPRNVLLSPAGPRLIDFDRCRLAPRERDVTYWGAWAWATLALRGAHADWEIADRFERAYVQEAGLPLFEERRRGAHRAAALLRIAHGWTALRRSPAVAELVVREAGACVSPEWMVVRPMDTGGATAATAPLRHA